MRHICALSISIYNLLVWANTQSSGAGRLACSVCKVTVGGVFVLFHLPIQYCHFLS